MVRNVAVIILYDKDKKVLLQHRTEDAPRLAGYWAFFGGGIEAGETPEQTVRRETLEELNYTLQAPRLIMVSHFDVETEIGDMNVYLEEYDPAQVLTLHEGQGMGWFQLSELDGLKIVEHDKKVLQYIEGKY